jgi:hypothetical protein
MTCFWLVIWTSSGQISGQFLNLHIQKGQVKYLTWSGQFNWSNISNWSNHLTDFWRSKSTSTHVNHAIFRESVTQLPSSKANFKFWKFLVFTADGQEVFLNKKKNKSNIQKNSQWNSTSYSDINFLLLHN